MRQKIKAELYVSPEMEVIEEKARQVMSLSGGINDMERDDDQSLDW